MQQVKDTENCPLVSVVVIGIGMDPGGIVGDFGVGHLSGVKVFGNGMWISSEPLCKNH